MILFSVLYSLGWLVSVLACMMVVPLIIALALNETTMASAFSIAILLSGFSGGGLIFGLRGLRFNIGARPGQKSGVLLVTLAGSLMPLFAAVPFYLSGAIPHFIDAYFEAISGLTSTGATMLVGIAEVERSLLFWRATLQWGGGFLTVGLALSLLPLLKLGGMQIYLGALRIGEESNMLDRLRHAGGTLFPLYAGLTLVFALCFGAAGMDAIDAVCNAMTTISTGGFSTHDGAFSSFGGPLLWILTIPMMIIGASNFAHVKNAFYGRWREYSGDPELYYLLAFALIAIGILSVGSYVGASPAAEEGYQAAEYSNHATSFSGMVFNSFSALTTTGFYVGDPLPRDSGNLYPFVMLGLIIVGGAGASTAGGLKLLRAALLFQLARREVIKLSQPSGVFGVHHDGNPVDEDLASSLWGYFSLYGGVLVVICLLLSLCGLDLRDSIAAGTSAFSNAGPMMVMIAGDGGQLGILSQIPGGAKLVLCLAMLLGRVEFFLLLTLLNPRYWSD